MRNRPAYWNTAVFLLILPCLLVTWKWSASVYHLADLLPGEVYTVAYEFDMAQLPETASVSAYLPANTLRQTVVPGVNREEGVDFSLTETDKGSKGKWTTKGQDNLVIQHQFEVEGKAVHFNLPSQIQWETMVNPDLVPFLNPSEHIQSEHPLIELLANRLKSTNPITTLRANFTYVQQIENSSTGVLTDALTTLQRNRASCNGKSRLFVALCRAQGIPARVVGGIILENSRKRTSHLWTEVYLNEHWIPFDVLNNHYATLPANYLELYRGDDFLMHHSKGISFDYQFVIQKKYYTLAKQPVAGPNLWSLLSEAQVPLPVLRSILLLPVAALVLAICRNVIGLKSFGIFLPALIGLSLANISLGSGLFAFAIVIVLVAMLHFPLEKWGLLHTPKLVFMLTFVVMILLFLSQVGLVVQWEALVTTLFLPVIILAITAERFAKTLLEDNLKEATVLLSSTFFLALICYPVFKADLLVGLLLTFPELYLIILGLMIFLGRWIGLRLMEYHRFAWLVRS